MTSARHRIGLLGDIHAEEGALALVLRVFAKEGADRRMAMGISYEKVAVVVAARRSWLMGPGGRMLLLAPPALGTVHLYPEP